MAIRIISDSIKDLHVANRLMKLGDSLASFDHNLDATYELESDKEHKILVDNELQLIVGVQYLDDNTEEYVPPYKKEDYEDDEE